MQQWMEVHPVFKNNDKIKKMNVVNLIATLRL